MIALSIPKAAGLQLLLLLVPPFLVGKTDLIGLCRLPGGRDWCLPTGRQSYVPETLAVGPGNPGAGVDSLMGRVRSQMILGLMLSYWWVRLVLDMSVYGVSGVLKLISTFWWGDKILGWLAEGL